MTGGERPGERLRALELRRRRGRTEAGDVGEPEVVGETGDERRLGPDDDEVDPVGHAEVHDREVRADVEVDVVLAGAGIAGRDVESIEAWRAGDGERERVLTTTATDDQHRQVARFLAHSSTPSNRCLVVNIVSWTGTGYDPVKHALQYPSSRPRAFIILSTDRYPSESAPM